jgi:hypothetical protein
VPFCVREPRPPPSPSRSLSPTPVICCAICATDGRAWISATAGVSAGVDGHGQALRRAVTCVEASVMPDTRRRIRRS